jgi:uncharacterized protein YjiS (DUF1127 family)
MTILIDRPARLACASLPALWPLLAAIGRLGRERAERRELQALDDRTLVDIGLDRAAVRRELDRPLWQPVDWPALDRARGGR